LSLWTCDLFSGGLIQTFAAGMRNHPPRGCPLKVLAVDVVDLEVVKTAILHYVETTEPSRGPVWRDITREVLEESLGRA